MRIIRKLVYWTGLGVAWLTYIATGKTPSFGYQSMIHLFCLTGGRSSDWISSMINRFKAKYNFGKAQGVLGLMEGSAKEKVLSDIREKGYHVFENRLPAEMCDRLLKFATSHPCHSRPMDGEGPEKAMRVVYPRGKPETVRYDFSPQDLLGNQDVQTLLGDLSFPAVAQDYLGTRPVIDVLSMWWHTAYSDKPDKDAAQYHHYDMDRPKWLKFFIYLTDVTTDSGAHTFVIGSHKTGGIPQAMLDKGYARLTDDEVEAHYGKDKIVEFSAPRGTIIAEDTRGLHKGKHVKKGDRLILQIQFSNTLFGGYYPKATVPADIGSPLKETIQKFPELYAAYR